MKVSALKYTVLTWVSGLTMVILLLMPFHAFLSVWGASNFGHYTELRLWKEALLALSIVGVLYLLLTDQRIRTHTLQRRLVWVILVYGLLNFVWGLLALNQQDVTAKALGYGLISNLRFLAFFLVAWAAALRLVRLRARWQMIVIWPAVIVVLFGLLQAFVLPHDFLRHFGYSEATIPAYETINNNRDYVRISSTLRGANPLGAYLVIPITLLSIILLKRPRDWRPALLLAASLVTLFFSFSRSAWLAAAISVAVVLVVGLRSGRARRVLLIGSGMLLVLAAAIFITFRSNSHFENVIFHTQTRSAISVTSNEDHVSALRAGLHDLEENPLGDGPGTAGPASVYNDGQVRIAENYYLQIGQETGLLGLLLFLLITAGVGYLLWLRRADSLALSLFASLVGLFLINMVSHAWTDDTLAYVWWGLAGIALAPNPKLETIEKNTVSDTAATPKKPAKKHA